MPRLFTGSHAVLLGTTMVEPGDEIPGDADKDEVKRLTDEGQVTDVKAADLKAAKQQEEGA
jgi:hypothetical protein